MNTDTMKDIIRDAHALAQSPAAEDLIRAGAETIARRLERLVERGLYITPKAALDAVTANPPMSEGVKECGSEGVEKRGLVGIRYNDTSIIAWNLADNTNIRIGARKAAERAWHIDGYVADSLRISGTVFGGKHATIRYVKFIRNGLTSRARRLKGLKAKRRAANLSNPSNASNPTNQEAK